MIPDSERTPTERVRSELELVAEDVRDLKVLCQRVDNRSFEILQAHKQWTSALDSLARRVTALEATRVIYPTVIALTALLLAGLALVR